MIHRILDFGSIISDSSVELPRTKFIKLVCWCHPGPNMNVSGKQIFSGAVSWQ